MNWEKLSEKLSKNKNGEYIMIFCDPADFNDPFIQGKIATYKEKGFPVVMKDPDEVKKKS